MENKEKMELVHDAQLMIKASWMWVGFTSLLLALAALMGVMSLSLLVTGLVLDLAGVALVWNFHSLLKQHKEMN